MGHQAIYNSYHQAAESQTDWLKLDWLLALQVSDITAVKQESPAVADKPTRRESMPKIAPIRRTCDVVVDNTGLSSFV